MRRNELPDLNLLHKLMRYDETRHVLLWNNRDLSYFKNEHFMKIWNTRYADKECGTLSKDDGYIRVKIYKKPYLAHRIIWKLVTGLDPEFEIDHKNCIRSDNRVENLRESTFIQNGMNLNKRATNTSGIKGVSVLKNGLFEARIKMNYKTVVRGIFNTLEEAAVFLQENRKELHLEFANNG